MTKIRKALFVFAAGMALCCVAIASDPKATAIKTSTTNFNGALSTADTDVQKALDTLDNASAAGSFAPVGATYITQTTNGTLTNEQALGSLSTGIVKNTTTTGVLSIAAAGTDYLAPAAIGSTVQAYDADLTTYAGITPSANVQTLLGSADFAAFKTSLSLNNVENTSTSTWSGSSNITTLGTITTGTWSGSDIALGTRTSGNYALGDAEGGAATTGDSATSFFSSGTIEDARLPSSMADKTITGSLAVPNGTNPTVDAAGEVAVDTSATSGSALKFYGDAQYVLPGWQRISFSIADVASTSDYEISSFSSNITIKRIRVLVVGGTNVVGGLQECDSNGANCSAVDSDITATAGTTATDDGSISNPTIDADDQLQWLTTSVTGTITRMLVTIYYTYDAVS